MIVNRSETTTWNAVSAIPVADNKATPVAYMSATFNGLELNSSRAIKNPEMFKAHKAEVDADYTAFLEEVEAKAYPPNDAADDTEDAE